MSRLRLPLRCCFTTDTRKRCVAVACLTVAVISTVFLRTPEYYGCGCTRSNVNLTEMLKPILASNISLYKNTYHWFAYQKEFAVYLSVHYDDRRVGTSDVVIRFQAITSFLYCYNNILVYGWFDIATHAYVELECQFEYTQLNAPVYQSQKRYPGFLKHRYSATCTLPDDVTVTHVSMTTLFAKIERQEITNLAPISYPLPDDATYRKSIGVCAGNIYGNFGLPEVFLFLNWMEALLMFGAKEVTVNNLNITNMEEHAATLFQHYTNKRQLTVTNYPTIYEKRLRTTFGNARDDIYVIDMALMRCLHDNRKRYWFAQTHDWDELFVPVNGSKTYHQMFNKLQAALKKKRHVRIDGRYYAFNDTHGFQALPIYVYRNKQQTNTLPEERFPHYMTMVRSTQGVEHRQDQSKSFQNPRTCQFAGIHRCDLRLKRRDKTKRVGNDTFLMYHFRDSCNWRGYCKTPAASEQSEYLQKHFGNALRRRVERVMKRLGYAEYIESREVAETTQSHSD